MDMHIHMSYCSTSGFRILASNYLCITSDSLFTKIDELMMEVEITPGEVAEELMKSEDADIALGGLIKFLQNKKSGSGRFDSEGQNEDNKCKTNTGSNRKGRGRSSRNNKKVVNKKNLKMVEEICITGLRQCLSLGLAQPQ